MTKFLENLGKFILILLLVALVGVVVKNNVPVVKNWVDGWSTPQQEQPAEDENNGDENNNENTGDENGDDENITDNNGDENGDVTDEENLPPAPYPDGDEPEANLQFFVFKNDFAKIFIAA